MNWKEIKDFCQHGEVCDNIIEDIMSEEVKKIPLTKRALDETYNRMVNFNELRRHEIMIVIDISKIDEAWKNDKRNYISSCSTERSSNGKYNASRTDIAKGIVKVPPRIYYNENDQTIYFENGRHRFSNFRDRFYKSMPVLIEKDQLEIFVRLFKYFDE